ncbi:MAG: hypothetical protein ABH840_03915 [Nanoarchaeota archaeon]
MEGLLVLVCKDYMHHPQTRTHVFEVPRAIERLDREGLTLTVDESSKKWQIKCETGDSFHFIRNIGSYNEFTVRGLQDSTFLVGVYDRTRIGHMQEMISAVCYKERERHSGQNID